VTRWGVKFTEGRTNHSPGLCSSQNLSKSPHGLSPQGEMRQVKHGRGTKIDREKVAGADCPRVLKLYQNKMSIEAHEPTTACPLVTKKSEDLPNKVPDGDGVGDPASD
jgi:hypothetical protein